MKKLSGVAITPGVTETPVKDLLPFGTAEIPS